VNDLAKARKFYAETLGLPVKETPEGLSVEVDPEYSVFLYPKPNHTPATFTVLNFQVDNVEKAVDGLTAAGVTFLQYEGEIKTDKKGIARGTSGPVIAWFADPAGNIISVVENRYPDGRMAP
ncbi:MAG TPA: VOC family protein, partial [Puia sp.]|nr:VOC family protein [Puia sp.]